MNQLMRKIIFIVCFILFVPTISPLAASTSIQFDYGYKTYEGRSVVTSTKDLILTEITFNPKAAREYMYRSDIYLVTESGVKNQVTVTNGDYQMFSYNDKAYVAMYNQNSSQFTLYDEQLKIIDEQFLASTDEPKDFSMQDYENYIVFTRSYYEPTTGAPKTTTKFYNLQTQAFEESVSTIIDSAYPDQYNGIVLTDKFSQVKKIIPYRNLPLEGMPYYALVYKDKILFFTLKTTVDKKIYTIYTLDFDGNLMKSFTLENSENIENTHLGSIIINGKLRLSFNSNYPEPKNHSYEYDLNTFNLTGPKYHNQYIDSWYVTDTIYQEIQEDSTGSKVLFKNQNDEVLSNFHYNYNDGYSYTTGDYQRFNFAKKTGNTQIVLKKTEWPSQKTSATIYDFSTGKELAHLTGYKDFQFLNDPNYILAFNWETASYKDNLKATLIKLKDDKPTEPTGPTYAQNKMWTVTTSKAIDADTSKLNKSNVYVKDAQGQDVAVTFYTKGNQLFVNAPANGYQSKQTYTLFVEGLVSVDGDSIKEPKSKTFTIQ